MKIIRYILLISFLFLIGCGTEVWVCKECNRSLQMSEIHLPKANFVQCPYCGEERMYHKYTIDD